MSLYEDLDIDENATQAEIKKAFKKQARKNHPDKGGDTEKFKKIQSSYMILKDEHKRKKYDDIGEVVDCETDAETGLREIFSTLISEGLFENDIVPMVHGKISEKMNECKEGIISNTDYIKRLKGQLNRFEVKGKNIYKSVVKQNIHKCKNSIKGFEDVMNQCEHVRVLLNGHVENYDVYMSIKDLESE